MVRFVDPRAEPGTPVQSYELAIDVSSGQRTIGLVANGFPDSEPFLDAVETALRKRVPAARFMRYNKHNASSVITDEMLDEVVDACDAVVAAYGH